MAHEHHHHHGHHHDVGKNISVAFFLNAIFVVIEVVGGLLTNSISILTDALHDFGDCLSLGTAWFLQKKSTRGRDERYSYGYKRFSLLGSVFLSGVLTVSSIFVLIEAVKRCIAPQDVDAGGMLWLAIMGIVINGAAAFRVKGGTSLNERAVYLHIMEDVLGWVAVLAVSIVMMFVELPVLDPILSILISVWVLSNVYKNLRATSRVFLQATPEGMNLEQLKSDVSKIAGVESVHDLHVWSLDGESHVMTLHIVTSVEDGTGIKEAVLSIAQQYQISHTTMEFERPGCECKTNCDSCGGE